MPEHHQKSSCSSKSKHNHRKKEFEHKIQLQLSDSLGFPVPGTEFWVTLTIIKVGNKVTLQLPVINFQTGPVSSNDVFTALVAGGYLYTLDGFLPKKLRPNDLVYRSYLVPSNNGMSEAFSFAQPPSTLPTPPIGYILSVTNAGALVIQCAGKLGNIIPAGPQILMPTDITYLVKPKIRLGSNYVVDPGFTNVTQFSNSYVASNALRDHHTNDAFDGVVAWTWVSNANIPDKTISILNAFVAVGYIEKDGTLTIGEPIQLCSLPPNVFVFDTAVTINRTDKNNIIASYSAVNIDNNYEFGDAACRAVSFDGGKTWPEIYVYTAFFGSISGTTLTVTSVVNGIVAVGQVIYTYFSPIGIVPGTQIIGFGTGTGGVGTYIVNIAQEIPVDTPIVSSPQLNGLVPLQTSTSFGSGDNRGVLSDKFGNIWYCTTNFFTSTGLEINQALFAASFDKGITYTLIYSVPLDTIPSTTVDDYPQFCFGGDGKGGYGLYFCITPISLINDDSYTQFGFIPINGFGLNNIDASNVVLTSLQSFTINSMIEADVTASSDGRVWLQGYVNSFNAYSYINPQVVAFKSPGQPINANWTGPWQYLTMNNFPYYYSPPLPSGLDSQPSDLGYSAGVPPQSIIYDDKRQALYAISQGQFPDTSQNMRIYFVISRNNGETWSEPIDIETTDRGNRGFQTMALDTVTGSLVFGFYDGRSDPTFKSLQYFGAIIPAKTLDKLVNKIPLSNPLYTVPSTV